MVFIENMYESLKMGTMKVYLYFRCERANTTQSQLCPADTMKSPLEKKSKWF